MCNWGITRRVTIEQRIVVDSCLARAVIALNHAGVRTTGSCCGHGKGAGSITITSSSIQTAIELGLAVRVPRNDKDRNPKDCFSFGTMRAQPTPFDFTGDA